MNGKKVACIVLLMIVAVFIYAGQILSQKATAKRSEAESAEQAQFAAQSAREQADIRVQTTKATTDSLRKFLAAWRTPADRVQNQTEVEDAIQTSLRLNGLVVISQRFEKRDQPNTPVMPSVIRATIVIQDEYAKTLNWVGDIERRLPLCRVQTCHITGAEEARQVQTEISIEVPLMKLNADVSKT